MLKTSPVIKIPGIQRDNIFIEAEWISYLIHPTDHFTTYNQTV